MLRDRIVFFRNSFIADDYKKEFETGIDRLNVSRGKLTAAVFIVMEAVILVVQYFLRKGNLWTAPILYYVLMYIGMFLGMSVFLWLFVKLEKDVAAHVASIKVVGFIFSEFILFWCTGISLLDQVYSGQIIVYTVAVMAVAVTPVLRPRLLLFLYLPVQAAFLIGSFYVRRAHGQGLGDVINSTTFVVVSLAISSMRYSRQIVAFNSQKLIEEKNLELERINRELQQVNRQLERLSQTDALTGLLNRAAFDVVIHAEWDRCRNQSAAFSFIMGDIDFFKAFNDHYGHQAGDRCIRLVADTLAECASRPMDSVARYGGEEFAVILPCMGAEEAVALAELMRKKVEALGIQHAYSSVSGHITISFGVSGTTMSDHLSMEELIRNADQALYRAKRSRNSVEIFCAAQEKVAFLS